MDFSALQFEKDGPIALLTLNRPALRNRFDATVAVQLAQAWDAIRDNTSLRAVVLTGTSGIFCTGASANHLYSEITDPGFLPKSESEEVCRKDPDVIFRATLRDAPLPKPLLVAVDGPCFGAGIELLHAADISVAGCGARFGLAEGMESIDAEGAREAGLIHHAVAEGDALAVTWKMSREVSIHDPNAVAVSRRLSSSGSISNTRGGTQSLGIGLG